MGDVTRTAQGNFDAALEAALSYVPPPPAPPAEALIMVPPPAEEDPAGEDWEEDWDYLLDELVEMGFEDVHTNKKVVAAHKGDLKSTVTALVSEERARRSQ